ncbi:uncharacterized protein LOC129950661 [Eupeodes corollae]|uniref:uncharacterized protein LOC129950661 n=1 Tax=Eupeodes corollae TaxID=290404 RepID=UPI0024901224|nr:uncharacterized protein LOC129950661 [Eupeodes corollae]
MNTMNNLSKIRVRSLEELNNNQNVLVISQGCQSQDSFLIKDSSCPNVLFESEGSLLKKTNETLTDLREEGIVHLKTTIMETESNIANPVLNSKVELTGTVTDSIQHKTKQFELKYDFPNKNNILEIDQTHSVDLTKEDSLSSQELSKTSQFSGDLEAEELSAILVKRYNNETDVGVASELSEEISNESFCLMDFVETVYGDGCNEIDEDKSAENSDGIRQSNIDAENTVVSHDDSPSFHYERVATERIVHSESEKSQSTNFKTYENTISEARTHIADQHFDAKKENTYKLDGVSLNQIASLHHKGIAGTSFSIDDFKYGRKTKVTAIFLTHFNWDHYHSLKGNLSKPIYLSRITAKILRQLIPVNESMLNVLDINNTVKVNDVKVTALDANYCPGAIMLLFELPSGLRILYTGDFRASSEMDLNPHLTARKIDLLYLDMSYISRRNNLSLRKVPYQSQEKNISDALKVIREFKKAHIDKRILFVFGHRAFENDELWLQIADTFDFKVWTDEFRAKMLNAIRSDEYTQRIVPNAQQADMHLIQHSNISANGVNEYWKGFKDTYDMLLAIKPNQWVNHKRITTYKGEINIAEIEYSGHSNESEIRRFLTFLLPTRVITIVPAGKDRKMYPEAPLSWYKPKWLSPVMKQASMFDFFQAKQSK